MKQLHLTLLPFKPENYDTLASWISDDRIQAVWSANTFPFPFNRESLEDFLKRCHAAFPQREFIKAVERDTEEMVGVFSMKRVDSLGRNGHLSMIMVSPKFRGKGVGAAMVRAALKRGFLTRGFRRIQLYVFEFNAAAKKCYETCGLVGEGTGSVPMTFKGETWQVEVMAIERERWEKEQM